MREKIEALIRLKAALNRAWYRSAVRDDWDEAERVLVRSRAVSAALAELLA